MIIDKVLDSYVWWALHIYFLPYRFAEYGTELDRWISVYSLNGSKGNICKPN